MRRIALVVLCLTAACGRSPSGPSSAPPASTPVVAAAQFGGLWNATFRVTTCSGDRHCFAYTGTTRTFSLRLQQSGSRVDGLFTIGSVATDVSGTVRDDGLLLLEGTDPPASDRDGSVSAKLELRTSGPGTLSGAVTYETSPSLENAEYFRPAAYGGSIEHATSSELSAFSSSVSGSWRGDAVVRGCTPAAGSRYCYPFLDSESTSILLTLSDAGGDITGTLRLGSAVVPVSGTLSGSLLTLRGEHRTASSGGLVLHRISDWTTRVDGFGRIKGSFRYEHWWPDEAPRLGESAVIELGQVFKES